MYLCRELADESYSEIGRFFNRNHATVMHDYEKIAKLCTSDADLQVDISRIKSMLITK